MKVKEKIIAVLAVLGALAGLQVMNGGAAFADWTCSDGVCKSIAHRSPDDGYDSPFLVRCGANLVQYSIGEGQESRTIGCNDVNQFFVRAHHSLNCNIDGTWVEVYQNPTDTGYWRWHDYFHTLLLCVDAHVDTIGGGGGGGGGGGTW